MKLYAFSIGFDQLDPKSAVDMFESMTGHKITEVLDYLSKCETDKLISDTTGFSVFAVNVQIANIWFSLKEKPEGMDDLFFRVASKSTQSEFKFLELGFVEIET